MKNEIEIRTDGINVYATLTVKAHLAGKIILTIFVTVLLAIFIYLIATITEEGIRKHMLGLLGFGAMIILFPLKYLLWNLFGKEYLIINAKTISYQFDYGALKTNRKTLPYDKLGFSIESDPEGAFVYLSPIHFANYNRETDLPEDLYSTTVLLNYEEAHHLMDEIFDLIDQTRSDNETDLNINLN